MKILLVAINAKYIHSNLAVYSLNAYARLNCSDDDVDIKIAEYTINNEIDHIINGLYREKPDILAFSCYIWNISYIGMIIREIKKVLPKVKIWLGGPEATYNSVKLLEEYHEISLVMKGEGEETFAELVSSIAKGKSIDKISGIDYRLDDTTNDIAINEWREPMDMSDIPFVYSDLTNYNNRIIYYESSRGCPFSCSYCLSSIEKKLRFRDIELVKKELKFFLDNKVTQVKFVDRTFNCQKRHAMEIWQFILENDNGTTNFHFEIAADLIDEDELMLLKRMRPGLVQLEIGIQSVNADTIKEIRRKMDIDKVRSVVATINSYHNIHQHLDLIAGLPKEDMTSFIHSFNEVYCFRPDELQLGFLKVLSGSYMYEQKENYGIIYHDYPPYEVMYTNWIGYEDILVLKLVEEMVECYYNSGQFVLSLDYLEEYYEEPFKMFYDIGKYYKANFDETHKHSRMSRYNILLDFFEKCVMKTNDELEVFKWCLNIDVYLRENAKKRPDYAFDMSLYKELIKYVAKDKGLYRNEHIEVLETEIYNKINWEKCLEVVYLEGINMPDEILDIENSGEKYIVIFDYSYKNPLSNQCRLKIVRVS